GRLDAPDETDRAIPRPLLTGRHAQIPHARRPENRAGVRCAGRSHAPAPGRRAVRGRRAVDRAAHGRHGHHPASHHQTSGSAGRRRSRARHSPRPRTLVGTAAFAHRRSAPRAGRDRGAMGPGVAATEGLRGAAPILVGRQRPPRTLIQRIPTDPIPRESGPMGHRRMDRVFVQVCGYCGSTLPKLAVLAASPVVAAEHAFLAVTFGLAFYAQAHARHGLAPGFWNWRIAFFTVAPARPLALLAARTRHRVGDRRVDLFLYRVVVDKTLGHGPNVRLKVPRRKVRTKCRSARCTLVERLRSPRGQCWLRNVARLGREW